MEELIKITEQNGIKAVSARELYDFLGYEKGQWSRWCKRNLDNNKFLVEGTDYQSLDHRSNQSIDYALTINTAKEISMMAKTEKGRIARQYFIECERKLNQEYQQKPMALEEMMIYQLQQTMEMKNRQNAIESSVKQLEQKIDNIQIQNAPIEHFSIMGYCRNIKKQISLEEAKVFGTKCRALCRNEGFVIGRIPDPRFGTVNTYPLDVLKSIIKN